MKCPLCKGTGAVGVKQETCIMCDGNGEIKTAKEIYGEESICETCENKVHCKPYINGGFGVIMKRCRNYEKQETEGLKPCPFCGSKAEVWEGVFGGWLAFCTNRKSCGAMIVCATKQDAIREWNRRTKCES